MADAARAMMPGLAEADPAVALLAKLRMAALKRLRPHMTNEAHRQFVSETCHLMPQDLSEQQLAHVNRLAWRYRFRLPVDLRPASDPGLIRTST